jgi:tetratricopeptide (TPR) repeat protein
VTKTTPTAPRFVALAWACLLLVPAASTAAQAPRAAQAQRSEAERLYQAGVDLYAYGRFPQALAAFQEALRRDPENRATRVAIDRIRQELAMTPIEKLAASPSEGQSYASVDDGLRLTLIERLFVWAIADERDRSGRLQAMQGRIAQLLAEKKVTRALRRPFRKDAELHALSRRLS